MGTKSQLDAPPTFNKPLQRALLEAKFRGLTQRMVAELAGLTETRMTLIARDQVIARPEERKQLAVVLGTTQKALFDEVAA